MGAGSEERLSRWSAIEGVEAAGLDLKEQKESKDMKIAYRLPWPAWLVSSPGVPMLFGD